jgi:excisionase family DNA binding protein
MTQLHTAQLTIPQAAERLGMTPDGVYKLIQRGKLEVERVSARKTWVPEAALDRYIEAQQAAVRRFREDPPVDEVGVLRERFRAATGYAPEEWLTAWKRDEIDDTPENMRLLVRAAALRGAAGEAPSSPRDAHHWARAVLSATRERA